MRNRFFLKRRIVVIGAAAALVLAGGGVALAYFTGTGTGFGQASVGQAGTWRISAPADTSYDLYPGSGSEVLTFTATNTGSGPLAIASVTAAVQSSGGDIVVPEIGSQTGGSGAGTAVPGCLASWFSATVGPTTPGLGTDVPAGDSYTIPVTVTMAEAPTNQDPCQGTTPTIEVTVG